MHCYLVNDVIFPNSFYVSQQLSEKGMVLIPTKCPILQYLDVSDTRISENTAIEIFKNLKFLHCINIAVSVHKCSVNLSVHDL